MLIDFQKETITFEDYDAFIHLQKRQFSSGQRFRYLHRRGWEIRFSVQQAVAPDHELPALFRQVVPDQGHFPGEQFGLVAAVAAGAFLLAQVEHFVHPAWKASVSKASQSSSTTSKTTLCTSGCNGQ